MTISGTSKYLQTKHMRPRMSFKVEILVYKLIYFKQIEIYRSTKVRVWSKDESYVLKVFGSCLNSCYKILTIQFKWKQESWWHQKINGSVWMRGLNNREMADQLKTFGKISLDGAPCELDSLLETTYTELGENPCLLQ